MCVCVIVCDRVGVCKFESKNERRREGWEREREIGKEIGRWSLVVPYLATAKAGKEIQKQGKHAV